MSGPLIVHRALIAGAIAVVAIGCASTSIAGDPAQQEGSAARSVAVQQVFAMSPGERVALAERGTLRYVEVKTDSRCPPERQCVWAGDAVVAFEWTPAGASAQSLELHTGFADKRSKPVAGHRLTLVSLARGPNPEAQLRFDSTP